MIRLFSYLQVKPKVGVVSGWGSGILVGLYHLFTDDKILKLVTGIGAWTATLIALSTLAARVVGYFKPSKK